MEEEGQKEECRLPLIRHPSLCPFSQEFDCRERCKSIDTRQSQAEQRLQSGRSRIGKFNLHNQRHLEMARSCPCIGPRLHTPDPGQCPPRWRRQYDVETTKGQARRGHRPLCPELLHGNLARPNTLSAGLSPKNRGNSTIPLRDFRGHESRQEELAEAKESMLRGTANTALIAPISPWESPVKCGDIPDRCWQSRETVCASTRSKVQTCCSSSSSFLLLPNLHLHWVQNGWISGTYLLSFLLSCSNVLLPSLSFGIFLLEYTLGGNRVRTSDLLVVEI